MASAWSLSKKVRFRHSRTTCHLYPLYSWRILGNFGPDRPPNFRPASIPQSDQRYLLHDLGSSIMHIWGLDQQTSGVFPSTKCITGISFNSWLEILYDHRVGKSSRSCGRKVWTVIRTYEGPSTGDSAYPTSKVRHQPWPDHDHNDT
jgi:hypothetical protein